MNLTLPTSNTGFSLKLLDSVEANSSQRIVLTNKPIPPLKKGQVLVKMLATPVNPSDLVYLIGQYGIPPVEQAYVGFEGCGEVIAANAGLYGKWLVGKRVAVSATPGLDGLWAKYAITHANFCLPVRKNISNEQAATLIVNPLTSICLVERSKQLTCKTIVINAAASQVGKGVIKYAQQQGIKIIAIVRSSDNKTTLNNLGVENVLLSTESDFLNKLKELSSKMRATVLLDAVSGQESALMLHAMPKHSTMIVYGRLNETRDPLGGYFSVADTIFKDCKIEGFWLANYIRKASLWRIMQLSRKVQKLFASGIFKTDILACANFEDFPEKLDHYAEHKSDGKVILCPHNE